VEDQKKDIQKSGVAKVNIGGRPFTIKKQFLKDLESNKMETVLPRLKKTILIMHDPLDKVVGVENARHLYQLAKHPKSFLSLDGAGHLMKNPEDSRYAGEVMAVWAKRYLPSDEKEHLGTDKDVVTRIRREKYVTDIRAGNHGLLGDEPKSHGGKDAGPSPYDYLMAALGSCTAMTLRMYADRKKWDLDEVRVHLSHQKIHAEDCEDCESKDGKIDRIEREIEVEGTLDDKQRQRLLEIANRCPVHRTLTEYEINVRSRLREEQ
jgi:putative redox protein